MNLQNLKATVEQKTETTPIEGLDPNGFFSESVIKENCSVKVAVRVRPLLPKEIAAGDSSCVQTNTSQNSVIVGLDKTYKFDKVFGVDSKQEEIFDVCAKNLILSSFSGYNSTVLAYGQTCSGKTFTMGTDSVLSISKEQQGIIPRVIQMMFDEIEKRKATTEFIVKVSFIEIYNEEIRDLLDAQGQNKIVVRELTRGVPSLCGQQEERVSDFEGLFRVLERGAVHRRTRATLMNDSSSRSHAILEINIEQHHIADLCQTQGNEQSPEQEFVTAKFHFVDLAGSERIKRTGAEGEALQEGISINKALFVLGKVINALTDESGRNIYKPYRESNLTRILQDSLGGNARTTMIACVSPADSNQEETLSTLLYACKARSIKNKPVVNRDPNSTLIHQLQQQVYDLQKELHRYKKGGPLPPLREMSMGSSVESELRVEVALVKRENESLKSKISQMEDNYRKKEIEYLEVQKQRDLFQLQNEKLKEAIANGTGAEVLAAQTAMPDADELSVLEKYRKEMADLQKKVMSQREEIEELQKKYEDECKNSNIQSDQMLRLNQELQRVKRILVKSRKDGGKAEKAHKENIKYSMSPEKDLSLAAGTWLSDDLNEQLKEVQEVFINELTHSLDTLIADNTKETAETTKENKEIAESIKEYADAMKENAGAMEVVTEDVEETKKDDKAEAEIKETLNKVEGDIHEREKMLVQIKEKHKEMQKNLISIMENQYHKKVEELEKEMEKLKTDQEKAVRLAPKSDKRSIEQQYKKRMTEYEQKLKEYRRNDTNQQKLLKQANEQESKIHSMTEEIMKMKQQKLELSKKLRKERENYEKSKKEQMREALKLKQETVKQKIIITRLVKEKERTAKLKEACKDKSITNAGKSLNYRGLVNEISTQLANIKQESGNICKEEQKQKEIINKLDIEYGELYKLKLESEKIGLLKKEYNPVTDYDKIKQSEELLEELQKRITEHQMVIDNLEATLRYHEEKVIKIEQTRMNVRTQLAKIKSSKEINEFITTLFEALSEEKAKRSEDTLKASADQNTIAVLTENIHNLIRANKILQEEFESETTKLKEVFAAKELAFKTERELLLKGTAEDNLNKRQKQEQLKTEDKEAVKYMKKELEDYKKRYKETMKESSSLRNKIIELTGQNEKLSKNALTLNRKVDDLSMKLKKTDANKTTASLTNLNEQRLNKKKRMMTKEKHLDSYSNILSKAVDTTSIKRFSQAKLHIPEEIKESDNEVTTSEEHKKEATNKSQNRGLTSLKATTAKLVMCRPTASTSFYTNLEELAESNSKRGIINTTRCKTPLELQQNNTNTFKRDHSSTIMTPCNVPTTSNITNLFAAKDTGSWKCVHSEKLHDFGITSLTSFEDYLISSSSTIKLWDMQKKVTLAKIPATNSKILYTVPSHKLLFAASEQCGTISLYNLPTMELVHSIDTGLDSVRTIYSSGNYIFIGGSGNIGALQVWDMNAMTRLHSNESNNEIQSIFYRDNIVYYGGKNYCVNRFRTDTLKSIESLHPAHYGPVNTLTNLNDTLISGCSQHLLRSWNYNTGQEKYTEQKREASLKVIQSKFHNNAIANAEENEMYTGGTNGHIKIWQIVRERLLDIIDLEAHDQSVNGIARIKSDSKTFASAGEDKIVKIWKYSV